jgi:hypothetical protein
VLSQLVETKGLTMALIHQLFLVLGIEPPQKIGGLGENISTTVISSNRHGVVLLNIITSF